VTTEDVAGQPCYRLHGLSKDFYGQTGRAVNARSITVWIDVQTHLVRQVREEMPAPADALNRITTTFEPQASA
jgi:hypothetical protein